MREIPLEELMGVYAEAPVSLIELTELIDPAPELPDCGTEAYQGTRQVGVDLPLPTGWSIKQWNDSLAELRTQYAQWKAGAAYKWLRPLGAGDLKQMSSADNRVWLWENYIPAGSVLMLAAYPKVGKSTFLYPLLVALTQGSPFLGHKTKPTSVLVLSEEPNDIIQERLEALGCTVNDPRFLVHTLPMALTSEALTDIAAWMKTNQGGLVVVDTVAEYMGIQEESSNGEIVRRLTPLKQLGRMNGATILYIHHDRKMGEGSDEGKMIRGGSAYLGIVDQVFMMGREGGVGSTRRIIKSLGRYQTIPRSTSVEWDRVSGYRNVTPASPGETGADVALAEAIRKTPPEGITASNLAAAAKVHKKTTDAWLRESAKKGLIEEARPAKGNQAALWKPKTTSPVGV